MASSAPPGPLSGWHNGCVRVANIPFGMNEQELEILFSSFGPLSKLRLNRNPYTGDSRGFAQLEYAQPESAVVAAEFLNGLGLKGRTLKVCSQQLNDFRVYINDQHSRKEGTRGSNAAITAKDAFGERRTAPQAEMPSRKRNRYQEQEGEIILPASLCEKVVQKVRLLIDCGRRDLMVIMMEDDSKLYGLLEAAVSRVNQRGEVN